MVFLCNFRTLLFWPFCLCLKDFYENLSVWNTSKYIQFYFVSSEKNKKMDLAIVKILCVSEEFSRMQEFVDFVRKLYMNGMSFGNQHPCLRSFFTEVYEYVFNEESSSENRRSKFLVTSLIKISVFWDMFRLWCQYKEMLD